MRTSTLSLAELAAVRPDQGRDLGSLGHLHMRDMLEMYLDRSLLFVFCNPRKHLISEKENNKASAESVLEMCELHTLSEKCVPE